MRKIVAWLPMYAVFWFGDSVCRLMRLVPDVEDKWAERIHGALYRVYNRCMQWSVCLNDWAGFKLWIDSKQDENPI